MARILRLWQTWHLCQKTCWKGLRFFSIVLLGLLLSFANAGLSQQPVKGEIAETISITVPQPDFAVAPWLCQASEDCIVAPTELLDEVTEIPLSHEHVDLDGDGGNDVLAQWYRFRAKLVDILGEYLTELLLSPWPLVLVALLGFTMALSPTLRQYWQVMQQPLGVRPAELWASPRITLPPPEREWLYDAWLFLITWLASERYVRNVPEPSARSLPHIAIGGQSIATKPKVVPDSLLWHHYNRYLYSALGGCVWLWTLPSFIILMIGIELLDPIGAPLFLSPTLLLWLLPIPAWGWMAWETVQSYRLAIQRGKTVQQESNNIARPYWALLSVTSVVVGIGLLAASGAFWLGLAIFSWQCGAKAQKQLKSYLYSRLAMALLFATLPILWVIGMLLSGPLAVGGLVAIASTLRWRRQMIACADKDWHYLKLSGQATVWAKVPEESMVPRLSAAQQVMQSLKTMRYEVWQRREAREQADSTPGLRLELSALSLADVIQSDVIQIEQPIEQRGIGTCPTCQARTLELYVDVQAPAIKQQGKEITESYCLHCAYHDRHETELPPLRDGAVQRSYRRIPPLPKAPGYSLSWPAVPLVKPELG